MKSLLLAVFTLAFAQFAVAGDLYTCVPQKENSLFGKVVVRHGEGPGYVMAITKTDALGKQTELVGAAEYYDDMTLLGYASKELNAWIEFDAPVYSHEPAVFFLDGNDFYVNCQ